MNYPKSQFVNLKNDESLSCGICFEILSDPVIAQCCKRPFCRRCITRWIEINNSCPNDRKLLTEDSLIEPSVEFLNTINKLEIRCDFHEKGCTEVLSIESLSDHVKNCVFNEYRECTACGLKLNGEEVHNCIESLKAMNQSLSTELIEIKKSYEKMYQNIVDGCFHNVDHTHAVINSARLYINNGFDPIIKDCKASKDLISKAIDMSISAIRFYDNYLDISLHIYNEFSRKNSLRWHVMSQAKNCGESRVYFINYYIDLVFDDLRIQIFDTGFNY